MKPKYKRGDVVICNDSGLQYKDVIVAVRTKTKEYMVMPYGSPDSENRFALPIEYYDRLDSVLDLTDQTLQDIKDFIDE